MSKDTLVSSQHASSNALRELRIRRRENQTKFWRRFGVSQSRGSRFELGLAVPPAVAILIRLYLEGKINDGDLQQARRRKPFFLPAGETGSNPG